MFRFPLPKGREEDPLKLADWLEIYAMLSADGNSSQGDLESSLRLKGSLKPDDINVLCAEVFSEFEPRAIAAKNAYPFRVSGGVVSFDGTIEDSAAYIFCLCLSYFGSKLERGQTIFPRRMFEDLSALAARTYVGGKSYRFAAPRKDVPEFRKALDLLCERMGEGGSCKHAETRSAQDDNLDIVAWKHFPDGLPGKILLFGQCATGENWDDSKLMSLQADKFCQFWLSDFPPSPLIRAYFVPHRVDRRDWNKVILFGGIMFDRCRIAYLVKSGKLLKVERPYVEWVKGVLEGQRKT
jgi:hypothetical protein